MMVKFDLTCHADPHFTPQEAKKVRGYSRLSREANYRTLDLTKEQAVTIFNRVNDFLETQIGAFGK